MVVVVSFWKSQSPPYLFTQTLPQDLHIFNPYLFVVRTMRSSHALNIAIIRNIYRKTRYLVLNKTCLPVTRPLKGPARFLFSNHSQKIVDH